MLKPGLLSYKLALQRRQEFTVQRKEHFNMPIALQLQCFVSKVKDVPSIFACYEEMLLYSSL